MPEFEQTVLEIINQVLGGTCEPTPDWLKRPGRSECGERWQLICEIYRELTDGQTLPEIMPRRESRRVDCVLKVRNSAPRIIEVDEKQHFNCFRAATLRHYPPDVQVAFDRKMWIERSDAKHRLEGGGFARPRPPLFPGTNGRHRQRAFRDALCDVLPPSHGFLPTLRIAKFDVSDWLYAGDACKLMRKLLVARFHTEASTDFGVLKSPG